MKVKVILFNKHESRRLYDLNKMIDIKIIENMKRTYGDNNVEVIEAEVENTCKHCGCTNLEGCSNGCFWVDAEKTVCSNCVRKEWPND